eukprot:2478674-Prymnesium_polylepis.1
MGRAPKALVSVETVGGSSGAKSPRTARSASCASLQSGGSTVSSAAAARATSATRHHVGQKCVSRPTSADLGRDLSGANDAATSSSRDASSCALALSSTVPAAASSAALACCTAETNGEKKRSTRCGASATNRPVDVTRLHRRSTSVALASVALSASSTACMRASDAATSAEQRLQSCTKQRSAASLVIAAG